MSSPYYNHLSMYDHRKKKSPVGCCGLGLVLVGVLVCMWLAATSPDLVNALLSNKPFITIPLPNGNGIALAGHPPDAYTVTGKPSLSAAFINRVLARAHSPTAGTGQDLYDLSVQYQIDDAYALAFFEHESLFGTTGMARVTHSLGNIRCSPGYQCIQGYRAYRTWAQGYADWYHLIEDGYIQGKITIPLVGHVCTTVSQIVPVYAPADDGNDVPGYIAAVERAVEAWRRGEVQG